MEPTIYNTFNFKADKVLRLSTSELKNQYCFSITSFQLNKNCPRQFTILFLPIMTIAMTALQIKTSRCFLKFYNRDIQSMGCINLARRQHTSDWDGYANKGCFLITKMPRRNLLLRYWTKWFWIPYSARGFFILIQLVVLDQLFSKVGKYHLNFTAIKRTTIITRELIRYKISLSKLNFLRIKKTIPPRIQIVA
jgi:hypothetical protein